MVRTLTFARPLLLRAAIVAAAGLLAGGGYAAAEPVTAITVVAPHKVSHRIVGATYSGVPIEQVSLSHQVGYGDLDLRKPYGAATLRQRVLETAASGCRELDRLYPEDIDVALPSNKSCIQAAVDSAMPQVQAALAAAQK